MEQEVSNFECHSRKDKFHLIRVPKGFDISRLDGVKYDPNQILEIGANKDKNGLLNVYEIGSFTGQKLDLNILVKSDVGDCIGPAINQNLLVTKTIRINADDSCDTAEVQVAAPKRVQLPQGLKERFTPFGSCEPTTENISETKSKKSRKSKKRQRSESDAADSLSPRKKRKREIMESSFDSVQSACMNGIEHKQIKVKVENGFGDVVVKQEKSEEALFVKEKKHKEKKKKKDKNR